MSLWRSTWAAVATGLSLFYVRPPYEHDLLVSGLFILLVALAVVLACYEE